MAEVLGLRNSYVSHEDFVGTDFDITTITDSDVLTVLKDKFDSDGHLTFLLEIDEIDFTNTDEFYQYTIYDDTTVLLTKQIKKADLSASTDTTLYNVEDAVSIYKSRSAIATNLKINVECTAGTTPKLAGRAKIVEGIR